MSATLKPSADSIENIKFEINGNDFINGKYDQIFWAPEHRSMDDGSCSFHGVYKDDVLYLSIRRSGFIEIVVRSKRIPKNILKDRKLLVYVTKYYNELNIDFEEVFDIK